MKWNYAIVAIKRSDLEQIQKIPLEDFSEMSLDGIKFYHAVMYEQEPSFLTYMSVYIELKQDPEFSLQSEDIVLLPAPPQFLKELQDGMEDE